MLVYYISRHRLSRRCCGSRHRCRSMFVLSAQLTVARSNRSKNNAMDAAATKKKNHFTVYFVCVSWQRMGSESVRSPYFVCLHLWFRKLVNNLLKCARVFMFMSIYDFPFAHLGISEYIAFLLAYWKWHANRSTPSLRLSMLFIAQSAVRTECVYFFYEDEADHTMRQTEIKTKPLNTRALHRFQLTLIDLNSLWIVHFRCTHGPHTVSLNVKSS